MRWITMTTVCIVLLLPGSLASVADTKIPPRCFHATAAATGRFGFVVADQLGKLDAAAQLQLAHAALDLAFKLDCPKQPLIASVDCIVDFVYAKNARPEPSDVAQCVKQVTGQAPFQSD